MSYTMLHAGRTSCLTGRADRGVAPRSTQPAGRLPPRGRVCALSGTAPVHAQACGLGKIPSACHGVSLRASRRRSVAVKAVFEKFSERSIKAVMIAQQEAKALGASEVTTEHVLLGLISEETASKAGYLNSGITIERAKAAVEMLSGKRKPLSTTDNIPFSREVRKTFEAATNECKRSAVSYIAPEHILLALLSQHDASGRRVLVTLSADTDVLRTEASKRLKGDQEAETPRRKRGSSAKDDGPKALKEFCRDLCEEVRQGRIDPVIGREKEVARVTQILARRTKNNPILLGEPGVGKTAIAEGLAYAIVHGINLDGSPLPDFLRTKRVLQLDVGLMIAGAKERGELENRVTKLINECAESSDVVLMIDEVHTLVGAGSVGRGGSGGGGLDVSNMLKPALARGQLQCIGATTVDEHRKYIEKDPALERRFQPVYVLEPTGEQTLQILEGLAERYERHHRCVYTAEALEAAVALAHRYIADRFMPDKAIDLIDEAGSRARINAYTARRAVQRKEDPKVAEYMQVLATKDEAIKDGLFEEATILRRREMDYKRELAGTAAEATSLPIVDVGDIENIVATWTGIPVERMTEDDKDKLMGLGAALRDRVIGQDSAVDSVTAALARARCGLGDPKRPTAALLFVGPTGVGKTELTKVLAEQYFGSTDAIIRLDMSEYMERHSVSKLVGAPPGYIGFGEGGKLTEAVRRRPCSIVLFDEIEKAHPDVMSILLQIMEDGRLTDSQGRTVSFKNTLVILTSNIGSRVISATGASRGMFSGQRMGAAAEEDELMSEYEQSRIAKIIRDEVKAYFRPELLNRFDEQVVFHKLSRKEVRKIAHLMMQDTMRRVSDKGYSLEVSSTAMDRIIDEGFSQEYGVRPLRQVIIHYVDDLLADAVLNGRLLPGATAYIDIDRTTQQPFVCDKVEAMLAGPSPSSSEDSDEDAEQELMLAGAVSSLVES